MKKRNQHIGSSLEDFLKEEGVLEETRAVVRKETLAWQVQQFDWACRFLLAWAGDVQWNAPREGVV